MIEENEPDLCFGISDRLKRDIGELITLRYKDEILNEISKNVAELVQKELHKVRISITERINEEIKKYEGFAMLQRLKSELKSELKKDISGFIKDFAISKIAEINSKEVREAAKKHFSQELLEEHKQEMTAYFINDLKKKLENPHYPNPINVVVIDKKYGLIENEPVPVELALMSKVYKYDMTLGTLPSPSGIYFLYKESKLQYIGQATCVTNRIPVHASEKDFDSAYFIVIPISQLNHVETYLINLYKPPLNRNFGMTIFRENKPLFIYKPQLSA